jgi:hypothetical protein
LATSWHEFIHGQFTIAVFIKRLKCLNSIGYFGSGNFTVLVCVKRLQNRQWWQPLSLTLWVLWTLSFRALSGLCLRALTFWALTRLSLRTLTSLGALSHPLFHNG